MKRQLLIYTNRLTATLLLVSACSRGSPATTQQVDSMSHRPMAVDRSTIAESTATDSIFTVTGPTFISSMPVTQAEIDSDADLNESLSDYEYFLSRAIPVLEKYGVRVRVINDSVVRWRDRLGIHSLSAADSGGILYLFVLPNGRQRTLRGGVREDDEILAAAGEHFNRPLVRSMADSVVR